MFRSNPNDYADIIDVNSISNSSNSFNNRNIHSNSNSLFGSNVKTNSWTINSYNITVSFTPTDSIFINIVSNVTFANWDSIIRNSDLSDYIDLDKFYVLMTNCFNSSSKQNSNYNIEWIYDESNLIIVFTAILDGFFDITQQISLKEKILSSDKMVTIKLTEMESHYKKEIERLHQRIAQLENYPIVFATHPTTFGTNFSCSPNSELIDFTQAIGFLFHGNYLDFNKLVGLKKIIMFNSNFRYYKTLPDIQYSMDKDANGFYHWSLSNLFDSPQIYLPNVQELTIRYNDSSSIPTQLRSLEKLTRLTFEQFGNTQLNSFELIKNIGKLKFLTFNNCLSIGNLDQIKNWSDSKNIHLEIK